MQSENEIRASKQLHIFNDLLVTFAFGDVLVAPVRKRMCADRRDLEPCLASEFRQPAAQLDHVRTRMFDRIANLGTELHHRLMHLRLYLLFEHHLAALEDFLNMRAQLARLRIDDCEFLLNAESKRVLLRAHNGAGMSLKNHGLSSRVARVTRGLASVEPISIFLKHRQCVNE